MTRVLFYEPSYRRIESRIVHLSGIEPVLMQSDGALRLNGNAIGLDEAAIEVGWANNDLFAGPIRDYMVALLKSSNLRWLQSGAAGFDNPVFGQIVRKGVRLTTNHSMAIGIAEYVLATVLDHLQRGPERRKAQIAHEWARLPYREVMGTRWLVIGFGAIGQEVSKRAKAFGAHITGVRRSGGTHALADSMIAPEALRAHLGGSDIIVLSLPLSSHTSNMVDARFLSAMKENSVLVNVGRGGLVDEDALLAALDRGKPAHAILDVFKSEPLPAESRFWDHPRVTLTGHASAIGSGLAARTDALFIENLGRYMRGESLLNEVDAKDVKSE